MRRGNGCRRTFSLFCLTLVASSGGTGTAQAEPIKNVIVMIADGAGINTIAATGMYTGRLGNQVFDGPGWAKSWVSTYPLRTGTTPIAGLAGLAQDPNAVYNSARNWDTTPVQTQTGGIPDRFAGYQWNKQTAPDSANTMVSVATGQKTYNNAVNVDGNGRPLVTLAETFKGAGKSVGVVSTVQFSDATPSVLGGAHNISRGNRTDVASEMINSGTLSVIMGTGNPDYNNNGNLQTTPDYSWISQPDWAKLKDGTGASGFQLIQDKADFEALANASTTPDKVIGIARSLDGTQAYRGPSGLVASTDAPFADPLRTDVPSLTTMTLGALNVLDNNSNGMFLAIEGGGVDRAMHSNNIGRMIEEKIEFDRAVEAITGYLDAGTNGNNWGNTLLIVTADHDHLLFGPDSDSIPFQDLIDNGAGKLPGYKWQHTSHSNQLVPLYARGAGSELFASYADQIDRYTDPQGRTFGRGAYLDQGEIYSVIANAQAVPEPSTCVLLAIGLPSAVVLGRRLRSA